MGCGDGYWLNELECTCEPLRPFDPLAPCATKCARPFELNEDSCTCECNKSCGRREFLDEALCACVEEGCKACPNGNFKQKRNCDCVCGRFKCDKN